MEVWGQLLGQIPGHIRGTSGDARPGCSLKKPTGLILGATVVIGAPFEMDYVFLSKDRAVVVTLIEAYEAP